MLRYTAQSARRNGVRLRERLLGNPVGLGKMASKMAGLANWANRAAFNRRVMEGAVGIHRDKQLPEFTGEPFERWAAKRSSDLGDQVRDEVVLFHTCFINYNKPDVGRDAVAVLERNGVRVLSPAQGCCGMPALDGGDVATARRQARANVAVLKPYAERGVKILAINPTCSYTLRKEYIELVGTPGMSLDGWMVVILDAGAPTLGQQPRTAAADRREDQQLPLLRTRRFSAARLSPV